MVNCAMLIQQETMTHIVRVNEDSHDGSVRSKASAKRTLEGPVPPPGTSNVVITPFLSRRKPWTRIGPVKVESCDLPTWR